MQNYKRLGFVAALASTLAVSCGPETAEVGSDESEFALNRTKNWNDRVSWKPREKAQPKTIAEVQALFRSNDKLRLGGALHSLNDSLVADKNTVWVDMKALNRVGHVETEADGTHTVWVEAGASIEKISGELSDQGYAFENLPTSKVITIGGTLANGVHGSSRDHGAMVVEQVVAMEIVDTEGNLHSISDEPTLKLVRVGIGSLGATVRVKLRVAKNFDLIHEKIGGNCSDLRKVVAAHDHAIIWYDPADDACAFDTWDQVDTDEEAKRAEALRGAGQVKDKYEERSLAEILKTKSAVLLATLNPSVRDKIRREGMKTEPATVGESRFQYQMWLDLPARNMSYAIPYNQLEQALADVKSEYAKIGYVPHFPLGMRVERVTDTALMAPNHGVTGDEFVVHVEAVSIIPIAKGDESFAAFERVMLRHQGRTHWAKEFTVVPNLQPEVRKQFETVRAKFDPKRKLVNDWVARFVLDER